MPRKRPVDPRRRRYAEDAVLADLAQIRAPLYRELQRLRRSEAYHPGGVGKAHLCCTRPFNQMRITPLEAKAIARAFETEPALRDKLPQVLGRLERELASGLKDNEERQFFDCPLLDGTRCLVHDVAKPIGCLAWHAPSPDADPGEYTFTQRGWNAFAERDELNDRFQGGAHWKLRVIPLWLKRVFSAPLERRRRRKQQRPGG